LKRKNSLLCNRSAEELRNPTVIRLATMTVAYSYEFPMVSIEQSSTGLFIEVRKANWVVWFDRVALEVNPLALQCSTTWRLGYCSDGIKSSENSIHGPPAMLASGRVPMAGLQRTMRSKEASTLCFSVHTSLRERRWRKRYLTLYCAQRNCLRSEMYPLLSLEPLLPISLSLSEPKISRISLLHCSVVC
jgi:hypothetical protein